MAVEPAERWRSTSPICTGGTPERIIWQAAV